MFCFKTKNPTITANERDKNAQIGYRLYKKEAGFE